MINYAKTAKLAKPWIMFAHSMGGLIALILCSRGHGKLGIFITPAAPKGINAITLSVIKIFFRKVFTKIASSYCANNIK